MSCGTFSSLGSSDVSSHLDRGDGLSGRPGGRRPSHHPCQRHLTCTITGLSDSLFCSLGAVHLAQPPAPCRRGGVWTQPYLLGEGQFTEMIWGSSVRKICLPLHVCVPSPAMSVWTHVGALYTWRRAHTAACPAVHLLQLWPLDAPQLPCPVLSNSRHQARSARPFPCP